MFQKRKSRTPFRFEKTNPKQLLKRVSTLCAGIFFLWIALHIMPKKNAEPGTLSDQHQPVLLPIKAAGNTSGLNGFAQNIQIVSGVLLIGLIGLGLYYHKKKSTKRRSLKSLQTLSKLQLGSNHHVYLVESGDEALLIGITNNQIALLNKQPLGQLIKNAPLPGNDAPGYSFTEPVFTHTSSDDFASLLELYSSDDSKLN